MAKKNTKGKLKIKYRGPKMATDILIEYPGSNPRGLVLIERKYFPKGIALPGGIAEDMPLPDNAVKEAREETGLRAVIRDKNRPFFLPSNPNQDPREYIAAAMYIARGYGKIQPDPKEDALSARLYSFSELESKARIPGLWAFQHHRLAVLRYLRQDKKCRI